MYKKAVRYLRGFYSYERSFNKRVLADDTEIQEAYKRAQETGTLPFNRTKILILGDHDAGKTSTCRRLQGKDFRHDEPSTIGIETNIVKAKVSDVNSKWCEVSYTPLEDYESSVAWLAVSDVRNQGMEETTRKDSTPGINMHVSPAHLIKDIFYKIIHNIPIIFTFLFGGFIHKIPMIITFLFGGFTFGFGLVAWIYILCLMSMFDVHTAYRFGSGYTIGLALIDSTIGIDEYYRELQDIELDIWTNVSSAIMLFLYGLVGLITGMLIGAGGRTGICMAFCFMVHPKQKTFTIENVTEKLLIIYSKAYFKMIICIFIIITISIFKTVHAKIWSMSRRNCILVVTSIMVFITAAVFFGRPYFVGIFTSSLIAVIVSCTIVGVLMGRKSVAYGYIPQIYIIKKAIGFIAGIFIAVVCGWEFVDLRTLKLEVTQYLSIPRYLLSLLLFLAPITAFIVYEWFAYMKVKNTSSIPITHIRQSMEASIRNESYLDARLSLWDFAGQEMYYNTHHLFMPKQGVYLVLFNAVEAVFNPSKQIKRLQFWLQSIAMHAEIENVVVLLVGTRRESVDDTNALLGFIRLANAHLYKRFYKLLSFHPSGSKIFFIENALQVDQERKVLREVIYNEVEKLTFFHEKFSVKYLLFNETLNRFRIRKCIITSLQEISEEVKSTCNIMSQKELLQFLNFFDRAGDVIYNDRDGMLRHYVICEPQMLVDILKFIVNVPEPHRRNRTVADLWQRLEDTGIVDSRLLEHICRVQGIWTLYPYVIRFLVGTHLLFPLYVTDQVEQVSTFCLSCRLPKINLMPNNIWNNNDHSQDTFYFYFGEILPEFIFLRLIAKCCEVFTWDMIYYNAARFRISKSCLFFINTQVISGSVDSYDRSLIKFAVHNEDKTQAIHVLQKMITFIEEIINRDFNPDYFREQYICGPVCKRCSSLDGTMCLVNLRTHGNDVSKLDGYRPDQYHQVSHELNFTCSRR